MVDENNDEVRRILEHLLEIDVTISAREVVRLHPKLANASAITRNPERQALLQQYKQRQIQFRKWTSRVNKKSPLYASAELAKRDNEIDLLKNQVAALTQSHVAMIHAVGEAGGMLALQRFYERHREIRAQLEKLKVLPEDKQA